LIPQSKISWTLQARNLDEKFTIGQSIWQSADAQGFGKAEFAKKKPATSNAGF